MILRRQRGTADATLTVVHRDLDDDKELALKSDQETGGWRLLGAAAEYLVSTERQAILTCLKHSVKALRPIDIARAIGRDNAKGRGSLRFLLHKMSLSGEVTSPRYGYYTHPANSTNTTNSTNTPNTANTSSTGAGFGDSGGDEGGKTSSGGQAQSVSDPPTPNTAANTVSAGKHRGSRESVSGVSGVSAHTSDDPYRCEECGGIDIGELNGRLICNDCARAARGIGRVSPGEGGPQPQKKRQCRECGQWVTAKATGRPGRFCSASCRARGWRTMREQSSS